MARIRTIKPEFFRHEQLQDAEIANPGAYVMLVFAGLWGHCDSKGRFEWRPRQLKLDILPFLDFQMAKTLEILRDIGMVKHYTISGKEYGEIASFEKHQRITGKEATEGEKHPGNNGETLGKDQSFTNVQEGKGREEEGKRKETEAIASVVADKPATPECPHVEIIALYHELLPAAPQVREWTNGRAIALKTRWREKPARQSLAWWRKFFGYVAESEFLTGRGGSSPGRDPFVADLEWLIAPKNFVKVIEGKYHHERVPA